MQQNSKQLLLNLIIIIDYEAGSLLVSSLRQQPIILVTKILAALLAIIKKNGFHCKKLSVSTHNFYSGLRYVSTNYTKGVNTLLIIYKE